MQFIGDYREAILCFPLSRLYPLHGLSAFVQIPRAYSLLAISSWVCPRHEKFDVVRKDIWVTPRSKRNYGFQYGTLNISANFFDLAVYPAKSAKRCIY